MNTVIKGKRLAVILLSAVFTLGSALAVWASVRLDTVSDVWWDEDNMTVAVWEEVEDAYQYEVNLYCDDSRITTFKTKKTRYNVESKMTREGEYTFRVRALAKSKDKEYHDGYWSDYSDGVYIDAAYAELVKNGGTIDTTTSGPGAKTETGNTAPVSSVVYSGKWIQNETGWWYQKNDGTFPSNGWFQDPATAKWYFFNAEGYMVTGWIDWNGARYYCGPGGEMYTGTCTVDGTSYTFDASGALVGG